MSTSKNVSLLASLFEEKTSNAIGQPGTTNTVSPSKKPVSTFKSGSATVSPVMKSRVASNVKGTKKNVPMQGSNRYSVPDLNSPLKVSETRTASSSSKVLKTIQSYESPHEKSLYLHGKKKMLSTSDIMGSDKSLSSHEILFGKHERLPLEHTSSAENLSFAQKPLVKHLILERQLSLEDTRKSPEHNDLKECEFIMKRLADPKLSAIRNMFEKPVADGSDQVIVKPSSTNVKGVTSGTLKGNLKSSPNRITTTELSYKNRVATLGTSKPSDFLFNEPGKGIGALRNLKFEIDPSANITIGKKSSTMPNKRSSVENSPQKRNIISHLKATELLLPIRTRSSSNVSSSSSSSVESTVIIKNKRASYENLNPYEVANSRSRTSSSTDSDISKRTDTLSISDAQDSDIYDSIGNTIYTDGLPHLYGQIDDDQMINSFPYQESERNGRNFENSYSTLDDDDDDHYQLIAPYDIKIASKSAWLSPPSPDEVDSLPSSDFEKVDKTIFYRKSAIKYKSGSTIGSGNKKESSEVDGKEPDIFSKELDIFGKEPDIFGKETDTFGKEPEIISSEPEIIDKEPDEFDSEPEVIYVNIPGPTMRKGRQMNGGPPPIPPRDWLPEAPPLPPRKQDEPLTLRTIVPLSPQLSSKNNSLSDLNSSSNGSLQVPIALQKKAKSDAKKIPDNPSEDYLCMTGLSQKSPSESSIDSELPELNKPDYNEDNLYGVNEERYSSCFEKEPLYQFCGTDMKAKKKSLNRDSHIYCEIGALEEVEEPPTSDTSDSQGSDELGSEFLSANARTLWHEMKLVRNSGILDSISDSERKCQEAIFEVITSEASYLKSLNILMNTFLMSSDFSDKSGKSILNRQERHEMFSNIGAVRETSEKFLADLEERWKQSPLIHDICDIITKHVQEGTFDVYIRYCTNMSYQDRMYNKLLKRQDFESALKTIERKDACQRLPMKTFLLLPMQRITRIPLLIDSICRRLDRNTDRFRSADRAHQSINKIVKQCNEGARQMESMEELIAIQKQLQFKVKEFPIISASRNLVKKGEAIEIVTDSGTKTLFKRSKTTKNTLYLYLFNDILLLTKKRGNHYDVVDYCSRAFLDPQRIRDPEKCKLLPQGAPPGARYLMLLVMLENCENKRVEMILAFNTESDCERWLAAVTPVTVEGNERIYSAWDCPEVKATSSYKAYEKDELSLEENDIVSVLRKMNDGWYYGERVRDGEMGWFPIEVTEEIGSEHSRARDMRLKYQVEGNFEVE